MELAEWNKGVPLFGIEGFHSLEQRGSTGVPHKGIPLFGVKGFHCVRAALPITYTRTLIHSVMMPQEQMSLCN